MLWILLIILPWYCMNKIAHVNICATSYFQRYNCMIIYQNQAVKTCRTQWTQSFSFFFFIQKKSEGVVFFRCSDKHCLKLMSDQYQTIMSTADGTHELFLFYSVIIHDARTISMLLWYVNIIATITLKWRPFHVASTSSLRRVPRWIATINSRLGDAHMRQ